MNTRCLTWTLTCVIVWGFASSAFAQEETAAEARWWKGNLHTHSLWSDGNDFPEMIAAWYLDHGYNFLALTDHNILSEGSRWMTAETLTQRGGADIVDKYLARFGDDWVETRGDLNTSAYSVRLKPLNEFRALLESRGEFLLIQAEEISDSSEGLPVHLNATNLPFLINPVGGATVREAIENNVRAVKDAAERSGQPILVHINHPNFGYAITAEEMAYVVSEKYFEIYNGHPGVRQLGDANHPAIERMWDIANTIRIDRLSHPPMFGVATDDSHNYHSSSGATSGRGWVMVQADHLTPESLIAAMEEGNFYASSGVVLQRVDYDREAGTLELSIQAEEGVEYTTEFIGTLAGYDVTTETRVDGDGNEIRSTPKYSSDVGATLATVEGTSPRYQLSGNELYVRALIHSSKPHPNPSLAEQKEQAWTQPVGWEVHLDRKDDDKASEADSNQ